MCRCSPADTTVVSLPGQPRSRLYSYVTTDGPTKVNLCAFVFIFMSVLVCVCVCVFVLVCVYVRVRARVSVFVPRRSDSGIEVLSR
jgi:heme/copper-type cytochrome/quinol oxidase subunit 2